MSDFSKLNGYDVKDAQARSDIENLTSDVSILTSDVSSLTSNVSRLINKKFLFVGDSYATGYQGANVTPITGFFDIVKNDLNLDATIVSANGYGFLGIGNNLKWIDLIGNAEISNKDEYTDILICGGMNDRATLQELDSEMLSLFTYLKNNFPNATIHVGCVGRYSVNSESNIINMRVTSRIYKIVCTKYGIKYIENTENILHHLDCFLDDSIHPNEDGQDQLAFGIKQYLLNNRISSLYLISSTSTQNVDTLIPANANITHNLNIYSTISDDICSFFIDGVINFTEAITINNLTEITIGQLTKSYICGSPYNQGIDEYITGYVYSTNEIAGSHFVKVGFRIFNDSYNNIKLRAFSVEDNAGVLNNLSITEIRFPYGPLVIRIPVSYC